MARPKKTQPDNAEQKPKKEQRPAAEKHLFVFRVNDDALAPIHTYVYDDTMTLAAGRDYVKGLPDGRYRLFEDTSGVMARASKKVEEVTLDFDLPRKRPRKVTE